MEFDNEFLEYAINVLEKKKSRLMLYVHDRVYVNIELLNPKESITQHAFEDAYILLSLLGFQDSNLTHKLIQKVDSNIADVHLSQICDSEMRLAGLGSNSSSIDDVRARILKTKGNDLLWSFYDKLILCDKSRGVKRFKLLHVFDNETIKERIEKLSAFCNQLLKKKRKVEN